MDRFNQGRLSREDEQTLYDRLLAGDPTAPADLVAVYLDSLTDWLLRHNRMVHPHECGTAAEDALLALIKNPQSYNPQLQTLEVYLRMSASGDLKNILRSEARHRKRRAKLDDVELAYASGKYYMGKPEIVEPSELEQDSFISASHYNPIPAQIRSGLTMEESGVLNLMLANERRTSIYAAALGIANRPIEEQRREVKRIKDRLKKRLKRSGGHHV